MPEPSACRQRGVNSSTTKTATTISTSVSAAPSGQFTRVSKVWRISSADIGDLPPPSTLGSRNTPTPSRKISTLPAQMPGSRQGQRHLPEGAELAGARIIGGEDQRAVDVVDREVDREDGEGQQIVDHAQERRPIGEEEGHRTPAESPDRRAGNWRRPSCRGTAPSRRS